MNRETELKILAYVDHELPARERASVEQLLRTDAAARALADELKASAVWLRENQPEARCPESREFYWGQVARRIEQAERSADHRPAHGWWMRLLAPAGAVAAVGVALLLVMRPGPVLRAAGEPHDEVEAELENSSSFTFRSEAEAMTVVWVDTHRN